MAQKEAAAPGTRRADATDPAASAAPAGSAASPAGEITDDIASMSYEQARDELVDIVARLENGDSGLEESMGLWQRGEALAAHCASWLDRAEARITAEE
jgi:exodeoxyribonuclease VII small subunit